MFGFRIIEMPDGSQIIDPSYQTSYDSLTPSQMIEYTEMDNHMAYMDSLKKKRQKEERKQKLTKNPLKKIAYLCGIL